MNHDDWDFEKKNPVEWNTRHGKVKLSVTVSNIPGQRLLYGIGVDPGRAFSVATLDGRKAVLYHGLLPKRDKKRKYEYGLSAVDALRRKENYNGVGEAVVEGAAFKMPHGQVDLAHVRMGYCLGLDAAGFEVSIVPPATIRAQVWGKGNLGGLEMFPELNHNAADALGCALYAAGIRKEDLL